MDTFVIALDSGVTETSPAIQFLPNIDKCMGKKISVHTNPAFSLVPHLPGHTSVIHQNFDHLVAITIADTNYQTSPHQFTSLFREDKIAQQAKLIKAFNKLEKDSVLIDKLIYPQPVMNTISDFYQIHNDVSKLWVSKPVGGARGLSMLLLDSSKGNISEEQCLILRDIKEACNESSSSMIEIIGEVKQKYKSLVEYIPGNEHCKSEHVLHCHSDCRSRIFVPFVPNVKNEYRLLTIGGKVVYIQERERKGETRLKVATGTGLGSVKTSTLDISEVFAENFLIDPVISNRAVSFLEETISSVLPDVGSVDLFFTEDGKFGIFEYSTEFGMSGLSSSLQYSFWEKFVEHLINKTFGKNHGNS